MNELKPCPFCGHKPILRHTKIELCRNSDNGDLITSWNVYCPECGTTKDGGITEYNFLSDETISIRDKYFDGRKKAVEKWNRRVGEQE